MKWFPKRKFYDRWTFDEYMQWEEDMFRIGMSVSSWMGDYGNGTCLNCRAIVSIGVPSMNGLYYAKQHREVCGDQNLQDAAIGDWWAQDRAATGLGGAS